jgi:hypothetical protein
MLFQQVTEGFIGELLEVHHTVTGKQIECMPRLIIELTRLPGIYPPTLALAIFVFALSCSGRESIAIGFVTRPFGLSSLRRFR